MLSLRVRALTYHIYSGNHAQRVIYVIVVLVEFCVQISSEMVNASEKRRVKSN